MFDMVFIVPLILLNEHIWALCACCLYDGLVITTHKILRCNFLAMSLSVTNTYYWWKVIHYAYVLFNSLAPGGFENIFQNVFFKLISWIDTLSNSCETALRSMPQNPSDDKSTLVQVMAWCRQAASHYLSQCCPRSLSPYGVTRPQWVNLYSLTCWEEI